VRLPARAHTIRADVDAEIAFHLEATERELVARGMPAVDAAREARRRFGNVEEVRHMLGLLGQTEASAQRWGQWWKGVVHDMARSTRTLRREPSFVAVVAITLALGMGANATMFRVVDRLLLRPAPHVRDDGSLSLLYFQRETTEFGRVTSSSQSYPAFDRLRDTRGAFADVAGWWATDASLGAGADARRVHINFVTPNFLPLLGVSAYRGRFFTAEEWEVQPVPTAVVTHAFAERELGGAAAAIGTVLPIEGTTYTVIGVSPPGFVGAVMRESEIFLPMATGVGGSIGKEWRSNLNVRWLRIVARRAHGVSSAQAGAAASMALQHFGRWNKKSDSLATVIAGSIIPARAPDGAPQGRIALWLGAVSILLLLVACANVANLLLARTLRRRREIAVHLALGVSGGRVTRALIAETLMLGVIAGTLALGVALWSDALLRKTLLRNVAWDSGQVDLRLSLFVAALVVVVSVIAGLVPAIVAARTPVMDALKSGIRDGGSRRTGIRYALIIVQGTLSVVLLVGAGLFVHSFSRARSLDLGFAPDGLIFVQPQLGGIANSAQDFDQRMERIEARLRSLPGVLGVTQSVTTPFESQWDKGIMVSGDQLLPPLKGGGPYVNAVSNDYFTVMGSPVLKGRAFTNGDANGSPRVAVVTETMARVLWPGKNALGECFRIEKEAGCVSVVGIAKDQRINAISDVPPAQFYQPLRQWNPDMRVLFVRARSTDASMQAALRRAMLLETPTAPYVDVRPMTQIVGDQLRAWQLGAAMFGLFGVLGLAVAAVGLYSVIAHDVAQRSHEIGVRMALGARREDVVGLVMRGGLRQAAAGLVLGLAISWAVSTRVADLLFETSPREPLIYMGVALLLLFVAVVASLVPARRAARVDPVEVLRDAG